MDRQEKRKAVDQELGQGPRKAMPTALGLWALRSVYPPVNGMTLIHLTTYPVNDGNAVGLNHGERDGSPT
tara:strand:+ start:1586 stop:1795 length:210 start_codon:yes stop_codon:yes gene_type:complete